MTTIEDLDRRVHVVEGKVKKLSEDSRSWKKERARVLEQSADALTLAKSAASDAAGFEQRRWGMRKTLKEMRKTQLEHGETLRLLVTGQHRHERILDEHGAKLDQHTVKLDEHSAKLDEHTVKLDQHTV
ncbi:hypothetical protein, partial [Phytoactinopolyspora endophytica]|uniref:hypothetical protein n=1 Tax=Phytoactinopolyspora endophytica TaxID=1642495 RepID=UPI0013EC6DCF